ncbi:MAG: TolC family protein [Puniceicoccales bacterium]|nr:TolC family protein [Puniceicoccales bacterium]
MKCGRLSLSLVCIATLTGCTTNNSGKQGKPCAANKVHVTTICTDSRENNVAATALVGNIDLDLSMLIDIALENNPETKRSWHAARAAEAQVGQVRSSFYPTVVLGEQVARNESNIPAGQNLIQKNLSTSYYPSVEIHYSLFQFGANKNLAEAAKQALCAANCQYNRTIQTVVHGVQKAYFTLCSAESTVSSNEHNLNDAIAAYESAFLRYQSGLINIQEYLQAKANKSQAEFELEQSRSKVESSRAALAQAIGISVSKAVRVLHPTLPTSAADMDKAIDNIMEKAAQGSPDIALAYAGVSAALRISRPEDTKDMDKAIDNLMGKIVRTRPDVAAAYANVQAKERLTRCARAKMLPELVIGGSGNKKKYSNTSGAFDNFNIFAGLTWKIFDGFKNFYDVSETKENLGIARQELRATELRAQTEMWTHYFSFKSASKQLQAARVFEQSAREAFEATVTSFNNGLCKVTDLISAQTCLANARRQRVICENNLLTSLSDLAYSTGSTDSSDLIQNKRK